MIDWNGKLSNIDSEDPCTKLAIEYYTLYSPNAFPNTHPIMGDPDTLFDLYKFSNYYLLDELSQTIEITQCVHWMKKCYHRAMNDSLSHSSNKQ